MQRKIALLSDVHGTVTALQAVCDELKREEITDCWYLGDLFLPGPGGSELLELLASVGTSIILQGNWDSSIREILNGEFDLDDPTDIYFGKLVEYLLAQKNSEKIEAITVASLTETITVNGLRICLAHHTPTCNYGRFLEQSAASENFDEAVPTDCDIYIYGHIHHQLLRYTSADQAVINPGSIGQPFLRHAPLCQDLRAQYAILTITDEQGWSVEFRKTPYDVDAELALAEQRNLPYLRIYEEQLHTSKIRTHDAAYLAPINEAMGYREQVEKRFTNQLAKQKPLT